jgi:hypothetical protein
MLKKIAFAALGLSLFALSACSNSGGRKIALHKTIPGGKTGTANTQNKEINDLIAANKVCLPLAKLVQQLADKSGKEPFLLYVQTRSLVDAGQFAEDSALNLAVLLQPMKMMSEIVYGSNLKSSVLIGNLLNATAESNCDQVSFPRAGTDPAKPLVAAVDTFTVQKGVNPVPTKDARSKTAQTPQIGAPGRLTLQSSGTDSAPETREYRIIGDTLVIDVTQLVPGAKTCSENTLASVSVRTRYVMNLSAKSSALSIGPRFAKLLVNALVEVPQSLEDAANSAQKVDHTRKSAGGGVPVNFQQLFVLSGQIEKQQFKAICTK